ncbi:hypothetical protein M9H77_00021 [Catharanthus roseus]|nr:hypothetical protein M9H77_00021 [Catharanthus roseus]
MTLICLYHSGGLLFYQSRCGGTIIQKILPLIVLLVSSLCWAEARLKAPRRRIERGLAVSLAESLSVLFRLPLDSLLFLGRVTNLTSIESGETAGLFPYSASIPS